MLLDFSNLLNKYNMKIEGVVHIGAHYGQEYFLYEQQKIQNIIFFEPLKDNFAVLENKLTNKNAVLVNKALGPENRKVIMNVEKNNKGQSSSILEPKLHLQQYPHIVFEDKEEVEMITLDSYFLHEQQLQHNFINIDVQGYELQVFKGAKNTLKFIDYIICEVNRAELYENCASVYDLDDFLSSYGFIRCETSWEGVTWGDALYVKS